MAHKDFRGSDGHHGRRNRKPPRGAHWDDSDSHVSEPARRGGRHIHHEKAENSKKEGTTKMKRATRILGGAAASLAFVLALSGNGLGSDYRGARLDDGRESRQEVVDRTYDAERNTVETEWREVSLCERTADTRDRVIDLRDIARDNGERAIDTSDRAIEERERLTANRDWRDGDAFDIRDKAGKDSRSSDWLNLRGDTRDKEARVAGWRNEKSRERSVAAYRADDRQNEWPDARPDERLDDRWKDQRTDDRWNDRRADDRTGRERELRPAGDLDRGDEDRANRIDG